MTNDLVKRLRADDGTLAGLIEAASQAADRIEELSAELAARDGEIADWLMASVKPNARAWVYRGMREIADAIEAKEYRNARPKGGVK